MTTKINNEHKKLNVPNLRFKEFQGEWEKTTIGEIATIKNGPFGSVLHAEDYVDEGMPIVTTEHFKSGNLPLSKNGIPQVSEDDYCRLKGYMLETDDIVFSRVGSVDINAHVEHVQQGWLFSGRVLRVRPIKSVNSLCLHYVLSTESVKRDIRNRAVGQTMPSINTPILSNTGIYMSQSEAEQKKIANLLSLIDERISTQNKIIDKLQSLIKGISSKIFASIKGVEYRMGDITTITNGNSNVQDAIAEAKEGLYPFIDRSEDIKYLPTFLFDKEAIIYPGEGADFMPRYFKGKFALHQRCYAIFDFNEIINARFLYFYLKTRNSYFVKNAVGSTVPSLRLDTFQKLKVIIPSKEIQHSVSLCLSSMEQKCNAEKKILHELLKQKQYLLRQMFI